MKQQVDVLAAFDIGSSWPRPLKFKILENGIKKTVNISEINDIRDLGAGGMARYEYTCRSAGSSGPITYRLMYYYTKGTWEIEIRER